MKVIINIEGGDGSGKTVITAALHKRICKEYPLLPTVYLDIPNYSTETGKWLMDYQKHGIFGKGPAESEPYLASMLYSMNRRQFYLVPEIQEKLSQKHLIVICNRSYMSNFFFNASRTLMKKWDDGSVYIPNADHVDMNDIVRFDDILSFYEGADFTETWLDILRKPQNWKMVNTSKRPSFRESLTCRHLVGADGIHSVSTFWVSRTQKIREEFIKKRGNELDLNESNFQIQEFVETFSKACIQCKPYYDVILRHPAFDYSIIQADEFNHSCNCFEPRHTEDVVSTIMDAIRPTINSAFEEVFDGIRLCK